MSAANILRRIFGSGPNSAPSPEMTSHVQPALHPEQTSQVEQYQENGQKSYSQCGEDVIADFLFTAMNIGTGTFLDIGAHHPTHLNNTFHFYKKGWTGINVDPLSENIGLFKKYRPRDVSIVAGIGDKTEKRDFYRMDAETLSTFDEEVAASYQKLGHAVVNVSPVQFISVPDFVAFHAVPFDLDLLSIDIEGGELSVIRGLLDAGVRPRAIICETVVYSRSLAGAKKSEDLIQSIRAFGYDVYADTFVNTVFVDQEFVSGERKKTAQIGIPDETQTATWVVKALEKLPSNSRILGVGCEETHSASFFRYLNYTNHRMHKWVDLSNISGDPADDTGMNVPYGTVAIAEPSGSFDALICADVLLSIPSPETALREFSRLLKDEGILIMIPSSGITPTSSSQNFYRGLTRRFYANKLEDLGFEVQEVQGQGDYYDFLAQELRRLEFVADKYSASTLSFAEKTNLENVIWTLERLSKADQGSHELMSLGYHVCARKRQGR